MIQTLYYATAEIGGQTQVMASSDRGLVFVGTPNHTIEEIKTLYPQAELIEDTTRHEEAARQLNEYFAQERTQFDLELDFIGTDFQQDVWQALRNIPYGETVSYQAIAEAINRPNAYRAVGAAIGKNPLLIVVPCHRVIGKNGKLTGFRAGMAVKEQLLSLENKTMA